MPKPILRPALKSHDISSERQLQIAEAVRIDGINALKNPTRVLTSRKGKTVETPLTDEHAVELIKYLPSETDNQFVSDLIKKARSGAAFSSDQMVWVHVYAISFLKEKSSALQEVGNPLLLKIVWLLEGAVKLKNPKIRLIKEGKLITVCKSSETSKYPNTIAIFCDREYFGRIETCADGTSAIFKKSRSCPDWVESVILDFAQSPVEGAKSFARLTGNCCFCNMILSDQKSIDEGYGPVCADRYGLPWGNKRR